MLDMSEDGGDVTTPLPSPKKDLDGFGSDDYMPLSKSKSKLGSSDYSLTGGDQDLDPSKPPADDSKPLS